MNMQPPPQQKDHKSSSGAVNNLDSFQSKSRLHFIGSWINEATGIIRRIFDQNPEYDHSSFFGEQNIVCHIDMDCFFVLVALSKPENAHLRDKPVAVASGGDYSEISSCSYKAREFGVRASMWLHEAKRLCPHLQLVKYDFDRVRAINEMIYRSAFELCPNGTHMKLQVISVDEFFVAFDTKNFELARRFCEDLRAKIVRESNGCTASCGIAPNVHVARAVTDLAKPNGVKLVSDDECLKFVREMEVDSIHGVGRKMQEKIKEMLVSEKIQATGIPKPKREQVKQRQQSALPLRRKREGETDDGDSENDDEDDFDDDDDDSDAQNKHNQNNKINNNKHNNNNENNKRVIVIRDLLSLSLDKLKRYLGQAMAEKLHNLAHKALDHTLVVGTGTTDSGALPKAVGTTMNYAVRLNQLHEFSGLLLQLCKDIESKLERVGGAALIIKLTVLVRHPEASVQTKKHLGCGWCDEYVLGQAKALSNEVAFVKAEKIHDTLMPFALKVIYVQHNRRNNSSNNNNDPDAAEEDDENDDDNDDGANQQLPLETKEQINTWRPAQRFVVTNENINSHNILITDLRGISVNASSIIIAKSKSKTGINGKKLQQQISIADSFRKEQQKKKQQNQQHRQGGGGGASTSNLMMMMNTLSERDFDRNENNTIDDLDDDQDEDDEEINMMIANSSSRNKRQADNRNKGKKKEIVIIGTQMNDGEIIPCSQDSSLGDDIVLVATTNNTSSSKNNNRKLMNQSKQHKSTTTATYTIISSQDEQNEIDVDDNNRIIHGENDEDDDDDVVMMKTDSRESAPKSKKNNNGRNTSPSTSSKQQLQKQPKSHPKPEPNSQQQQQRGVAFAQTSSSSSSLDAKNKNNNNKFEFGSSETEKRNNDAFVASAISTFTPTTLSLRNPLCMMSIILVAAKNGKIKSILSSKDPATEELRRQAAEFVLNESVMPLGMGLVGMSSKKAKKTRFSEEEVELAGRILQ